jgi:hypothetical protein
VVAVYAFGRDDGYFNSDRKELRSGAYAITSGQIDLGADELDWAPNAILGISGAGLPGPRRRDGAGLRHAREVANLLGEPFRRWAVPGSNQ